MKSITGTRLRVKHQNAKIAHSAHPGSIAEFLRHNPLPPKYTHLEQAIRKLPDAATLVETILNCAKAGMNDAQFGAAIQLLGDWYATKSHRCSACLDWTDSAQLICSTLGAKLHTISVCPACLDRLNRGQVSEAMRRNLASYGGGE